MRYVFGDYVLDPQRYELYCVGKLVPVRPKVCEVLAYLLAHRDRVVSKDELIARLWAGQYARDATLNSCILEVRKAIGDSGQAPRLLRTVRGRGYRFVAPAAEQEQTPPPSPTVATVPHAGEACRAAALTAAEEYKHVTVLCCTVGEAPTLAVRLGPEAMHQVMQAVVACAEAVVQRYEGTMAHVTGDGFTALFGAPVAQEDHARRAVLAALEIRQHLHTQPLLRLQTRGEAVLACMGVHTGSAVVGCLPHEPQRLYTAIGASTHLATRLQHLARPGTILISAATYRLVQGEVHVEACGTVDGDAGSTPIPVYTVQGIVRRRAGVPGWGARPMSRFVGRRRELAFLHQRLAQTAQGQGQVVGIVGEPGMGKSRLLYEFVHSLRGQAIVHCEGHCLAYGRTTPYLLVRDLLRQVCGLREADGPETITANVSRALQEAGMAPAVEMPLLLQLLDVPGDAAPLEQLSPQARKVRTFTVLHQVLLHASQGQPLLLAVENCHWIDATSAEWLAAFVERLSGAAVLLLATYRPGYHPAWLDKSYATQLALPRLTPRESLVVMQSVAQTPPLPEPLRQEIITKAAGNPFFLEELARSTSEAGSHDAALTVPDTVQAVLAARIDRLPPAEKQLLQTAAVVGKDVSVPLLRAITALPEKALDDSLTSLHTAEFLDEISHLPAVTYTFKHALIQEVAYQSLLQRTRQHLHQQTAQVLSERFPETVATQPELLAYHYTEAGATALAMRYWQHAGERAEARSAHVEAIAHLTKGLELLQTLPETPSRTHQELMLRLALGWSLRLTRGSAATEVEQTYARARALCQQVEGTPQLATALYGLWTYYYHRAELQTAREVAEQLLTHAQRVHDPGWLMQAYQGLGSILFQLGAFAAARARLEQALVCSTAAPLVSQVLVLTRTAWSLWFLGYPDQAVERVAVALARAREGSRPYSLATALAHAGSLHQWRCEPHIVAAYADELLALSAEHGFSQWVARAMILRGWLLVRQGQGDAGIAQLQQGIAAYRATGAEVARASHLVYLAEAYGTVGQPEAGLEALAEAQALVDKTGDRWREAEGYRIQGELLLQSRVQGPQSAHRNPHAEAAEACFWHAFRVARCQEAKSLELRAAMSLSRLWHCQGKLAEARQFLAGVYGWFTEGFATADLQEAKMWLALVDLEQGDKVAER
jgi:class 3 adenylate cyclase/predicted ATPase